jgi:hypothetical protein
MDPPTQPGAPWTETIVHAFSGPDGASPIGALTMDSHGNLFGTTFEGGASRPLAAGNVFELSPPATPGDPWALSVLYSFPGNDGDLAYPQAGVIFDKAGIIYGTANTGTGNPHGARGTGGIFKLTPPTDPGGAWTETVLHYLNGGTSDGSYPFDSLVFGEIWASLRNDRIWRQW